MARQPGRAWGVAAALYTGVIAMTAYAGALALLAGVIDFGDEIDARLPFRSLALAGVALLVWVALPMTLAAWCSARHLPRADQVVGAAGLLLVGWIAVQLAFIQAYSWFHPTYLAIAVVTILLGWRMGVKPRDHARPTEPITTSTTRT